VDQKNGSSERKERDEQMIWMFVREMNEKFRSLENMFKEMGNMNGKLVDALINNTKNKDMRDNLDASKYEVQMLQERLKAAAEVIGKRGSLIKFILGKRKVELASNTMV